MTGKENGDFWYRWLLNRGDHIAGYNTYFSTINIFHGYFSEEKVDIIFYFIRRHKIWICNGKNKNNFATCFSIQIVFNM